MERRFSAVVIALSLLHVVSLLSVCAAAGGSPRRSGLSKRCQARGALDLAEREVDPRSCLSQYDYAWDKEQQGNVKLPGIFASPSLHSSKDRLQRFYECSDKWPWTMVNVSLNLLAYILEMRACPKFVTKAEELLHAIRPYLGLAMIKQSSGQVWAQAQIVQVFHICVPSFCTKQELVDQLVPFWIAAGLSGLPPASLFAVLPSLTSGVHVNISDYDAHQERLEWQRLQQQSWAAAHVGLRWSVQGSKGIHVPDCSLLRLEASVEVCRAEALEKGFMGFAWDTGLQQCCFTADGQSLFTVAPGSELHLREPLSEEQREKWSANIYRPSRLAVCLRGEVRGFYRPEVHLSIRDHLLLASRASEIQLFFVLNLTSTSCHHCESPEQETRQFSLEDLTPAFAALPPAAALTVDSAESLGKAAMDAAALSEGFADCHFDQFSCPAIGAQLAQCWKLVQAFEQERGNDFRFDWLIAARPDAQFMRPLGDLRSFDPERVHASFAGYCDVADSFALVPRRFAGAYFRPWFPALGAEETRSSACLTQQGCEKLGCKTCSCGCLFQTLLEREGVPLGRLPFGLYEFRRT